MNEMHEKMSFKIGVKFGFYSMGRIFEIKNNRRYICINNLNLILAFEMGMNWAEGPFDMRKFYNSRSHSKWVCFQIPNTDIRAFLYRNRPPPPAGGVMLRSFIVVTVTEWIKAPFLV